MSELFDDLCIEKRTTRDGTDYIAIVPTVIEVDVVIENTLHLSSTSFEVRKDEVIEDKYHINIRGGESYLESIAQAITKAIADRGNG